MAKFEFEYQIGIDAKPDDVWAYVADLTKHSEWNDGLTVEAKGDGPAAVGSEYVSNGRMMGRTFENQLRVSEFDAPNRFCFVATNGKNDVLQEFNLTAEGESTVLDRRVSGDLNPVMSTMLKLLSPMVGHPQMRKSLNALKEHVEGSGG